MKRTLFLFIGILTVLAVKAQYEVSGGTAMVYEYERDLSNTNISKVYIINGLSGATIKYESTSASVRFYYYTQSLSDNVSVPAGDISTITSGGRTTYIISNLLDSKGYYAIDGETKKAAWIIDYSQHHPVLNSIDPIEDLDRCDNLKLMLNKSDDLFFYGTSGIRRQVRREYTIEYNDLRWSETEKKFDTESIRETNISGNEPIIDAPLMSTEFTLKGDQFAEYFGLNISVISTMYEAKAVETHIVAEQEKADGSFTEELGGSAPAKISFYGYANEPVAYYYDWYIYKKEGNNLGEPITRYTDRDFYYTFDQSGEFVVKLEVASQESACTSTHQIEFKITESELDIPNFFSPGSSGMNNEFRVHHKSIIKFKCTIFNRWGVKLHQFNDPDKGWDGKYKGKYVNPGVYYYVIEATGADGERYKKMGDINILR